MKLDFEVLFYAGMAMSPALVAAQNLVALDSTITYQTIHGWEVTSVVARITETHI